MLPPLTYTDFLQRFFGLPECQSATLWQALPQRQRDRLRNVFSKIDNTKPYSARRERLAIQAADLMPPRLLVEALECAIEHGDIDRMTGNAIQEKLLAAVGQDGAGNEVNGWFRTTFVHPGDTFTPTPAELRAFGDQMIPAGDEMPAPQPPALSTLSG